MKKKMTDKQRRLAALAAPRDKITRADIIAGAKKRQSAKSNDRRAR
tara:strand:+ start:252 stop:389 length:138 start_codon:yes stop_codon:yes gene_type:complete